MKNSRSKRLRAERVFISGKYVPVNKRTPELIESARRNGTLRIYPQSGPDRIWVSGQYVGTSKSLPGVPPGRYETWADLEAAAGCSVLEPEERAKTDPILERIRRENQEVLSGLGNKQANTPEGFIYVITNPAWPGFSKVGRALDPEDRLRSYQTGDPHRAYVLEGYFYAPDRKATEKKVHNALEKFRLETSEWFRVPAKVALAVAHDICAGFDHQLPIKED